MLHSISYRKMRLMQTIKAIFCSLLLGAFGASNLLFADSTQSVASTWDVPGITEAQLSADYWVDRIDNPDQVIKDQQGIAEFNQALFATDVNMVNLAVFPEELSGIEVRNIIQAVSKPNRSELYDPAGVLLGPEGYKKYTENLDLDKLAVAVDVKFALVVKRADMRAYPTDDRYYKDAHDQNLDRFQENAVFPGDTLAVLHTSADKEWFFVQSYNYAAWVRSNAIAIGDRRTITQYMNASRFLVIAGDKVHTNFNPENPTLSELQLDMGIRVPLADRASIGNSLYGQNPYASHAVLLPVRNPEGNLEIMPALIARNQDISPGFIPFTRENIIRQSFKFLGERYGWGHSYNARDCTGFVMEIYKTFGFSMPRNTGQQGSGSFGKNRRFTAQSSREEKLRALEEMDIGDLIYVAGHVLMYIGDVDGKPYVIHDVSVFRYINENGEYYEGTLNGVSVTPLIPLYGSRESTYLDQIYNIKSLR